MDSVTVGKADKLAEYDGALGNFLREEFQRQLKSQGSSIDSVVATEFLQLYEKQNCGTNYFDTTLDVSAKGLLDQWRCKGERFTYFKEPGFENVLNLLARKNNVSLEGKVLLNKKVTEVNYSEQNLGKVTVTCSDGTTISADHVVITLPLGVLKHR